ncbi:hypothetical protein MJO29_008388 [Puccinia striiformis f. sp. tritici]|uniref:hypothetical protein n=1 Tax=Puccinia striiformis f. sp. tritici TaxID=168172 RepID=UPI00200784A0|nr:hypothetical protein Pst134EA_015439 [Puccinia striiformis f. sp. tritici]KAH9463355.1 hypothetical protein Pst134EA_015439 [Puccinia striiformis f. sp. tritici]KAI7952757.1 hypothetical protein MJO29_008388 [Puccinia striiformis f. sp. tritici]
MPHTNSKEWLKRNKLPNRKPLSSKKSTGSTDSRTGRRPQLVEYDENDRYDYLTGFSARKKAGKVAAQGRAALKAREEKLEFRRQLKDARMSKIKEAIDQQTEWYGIDTFAGLEELDQPTNTSHQTRPTTRKVEKFVEQSKDGTGAHSQTTTTVTIEPLELDHTVLMTNPEHHYQPPPSNSYLPHPDRNFHNIQPSSSSGIRKLPVGTDHYQQPQRTTDSSRKTSTRFAAAGGGSKTKSNKKKKIPYESKATRTIERVKKQAKRDSKSSSKKKSSSSSRRK